MKMKPLTTRSKLSVGLTAAAVTLLPLLPAAQVSADETRPVAAVADACSTVPWMKVHKSASERARSLLAASSLDQKLRWLDEVAANNPQQTEIPIRNPANPFGPTTTVTMPAQVACTPTMQYTDGPGSVNADGGTTTFPAPVSLAASWSRSLARAKGAAQADEAWHKQRNVLLAPGIASGRDPRNGRTSEYLSEDGLLAGLMAAAGTKGITGNPDEPVEAVIKHYVGNEQELDRQTSNDNVDQRTLREIYTLPFEVAIDRGKVGGVMCAYNQVNHRQACENENTLKQILKTEIGFNGFVVTDFFAKHSPDVRPPDLKAGLDQELNAWLYWSPAILKQAIADGTITEADIDEAAFRVVRAHIAAGLFDVARPATSSPVVTTAAHQAVARTVAEKGSVLLKNDGVLPLRTGDHKIAVIGPTASSTPTNGVSARTVCSYSGFGGGTSCTPVAPLDSITARAAQQGATVSYDNGSDLASATATAKAADVAVVFGYYREGEGADRPNISLDGGGNALVNAVASANKNTIVVLQTGGPVLMPWLTSVKGVLETWYAGEQMGPAVASLLFGDVNPSGKLPYTFPKSESDLPTAGSPRQYPGTFADGSTVRPAGSTEIRQVDYSEGMQVGYRWYASKHIKPLFPFGYGLSYSSFDYSHLQVTPTTTNGRNEIRVRFRLTNTSRTAGTEVAQAYVELPSVADEPSKRLLAWKRVHLRAGESEKVEIAVSPKDVRDLHLLDYWSAATGRWTTPRGNYRISVGGSFDTASSDSITLH